MFSTGGLKISCLSSLLERTKPSFLPGNSNMICVVVAHDDTREHFLYAGFPNQDNPLHLLEYQSIFAIPVIILEDDIVFPHFQKRYVSLIRRRLGLPEALDGIDLRFAPKKAGEKRQRQQKQQSAFCAVHMCSPNRRESVPFTIYAVSKIIKGVRQIVFQKTEGP